MEQSEESKVYFTAGYLQETGAIVGGKYPQLRVVTTDLYAAKRLQAWWDGRIFMPECLKKRNGHKRQVIWCVSKRKALFRLLNATLPHMTCTRRAYFAAKVNVDALGNRATRTRTLPTAPEIEMPTFVESPESESVAIETKLAEMLNAPYSPVLEDFLGEPRAIETLAEMVSHGRIRPKSVYDPDVARTIAGALHDASGTASTKPLRTVRPCGAISPEQALLGSVARAKDSKATDPKARRLLACADSFRQRAFELRGEEPPMPINSLLRDAAASSGQNRVSHPYIAA